MEKDNQKNVVNNFEAGSNCQVFNGNIRGCVFAMPGFPAEYSGHEAHADYREGEPIGR